MAKNKTAKKLPPQLAAWGAVMNEVKAAHPEYSLKKRMQAAKKIYRKSKKSKSMKGGYTSLADAYGAPSMLAAVPTATEAAVADAPAAVEPEVTEVAGGKKNKKEKDDKKK